MTLPPAYTLLRAGTVQAAVRCDLADTLAAWLLAPELCAPGDAEPIAGGRGAAWRLCLPGGARAVLRRYRRGGFFARWVTETYVDRPLRPLRELAVTVEARARGAAVPEVLAARVEGRVLYRGAILTAEIPGATPVLDALAATPDAEARRALARRAGEAVASLHVAGVVHADLNCGNILLAPGATAGATVIDLDRASLRRGPLGRWRRRRALRRLHRSLAKLDPGGARAGSDAVAAFRDGYAARAGGPCAC
ncbi:MAG: 3-deoxy-D-manno-octulosonic acid kinase [bacterium]|nr:3-deoxy-D-manno-octulosonic acid kinase [bacterium]